jgi:alcohol dehydrogenase YqhD (iron-dependent ADH family)
MRIDLITAFTLINWYSRKEVKMNNFIFENATKVYFGKGCVKEYLACNLSKYGNNVMLAYGRGSINKNGIYDEVVDILKASGKQVTEFSGIMPNPTYGKVLEGAHMVRENHVDVILGVGGGSVMDCCKAISMAAATDKDIWKEYWEKLGVIDFQPIPVGVIVTVAGTGSEMNGGAVITNEEKQVKTGRDYPKCNPQFALMDPVYTFSVSPLQTASGGFDILSHIMETYFSEPNEDNVSDDISEALMRCVIKNIRVVMKNPEDYTARSNLMWASAMSENRIIKLGKKMDFECHQIEHQMGAYSNCNHGCGLSVISPVYYRHIYEAGLQKFVHFAVKSWGVQTDGKSDKQVAREGIEALSCFIKEISLPTTLNEIGITQKQCLKEIADSCNISNGSYKRMTHEEILSILEECF